MRSWSGLKAYSMSVPLSFRMEVAPSKAVVVGLSRPCFLASVGAGAGPRRGGECWCWIAGGGEADSDHAPLG